MFASLHHRDNDIDNANSRCTAPYSTVQNSTVRPKGVPHIESPCSRQRILGCARFRRHGRRHSASGLSPTRAGRRWRRRRRARIGRNPSPQPRPSASENWGCGKRLCGEGRRQMSGSEASWIHGSSQRPSEQLQKQRGSGMNREQQT